MTKYIEKKKSNKEIVMAGACGIITRVLLGIINVLFLIVGIALVVLSCLLKWANLGNLQSYKAVATASSVLAIDGVAIALIAIGGFTIFVSVIGLLGLSCSNRCLLIFYEVISLTIILFSSLHTSSFPFLFHFLTA